VPIATGAAHVYTECARIWNPIHTDAAVAESAGLPAIILHGTATLALAVSRVVAAEARDEPERVVRVAGRFGAMVLMPSEIVVRILARRNHARGIDGVHFEVRNHDGAPAVRDGFIALRT
jgi:acyl dehydratase